VYLRNTLCGPGPFSEYAPCKLNKRPMREAGWPGVTTMNPNNEASRVEIRRCGYRMRVLEATYCPPRLSIRRLRQQMMYLKRSIDTFLRRETERLDGTVYITQRITTAMAFIFVLTLNLILVKAFKSKSALSSTRSNNNDEGLSQSTATNIRYLQDFTTQQHVCGAVKHRCWW
jgi:hypothetical protein